MIYRFHVDISLKSGVLDIQGKAIMHSLHNAGETSVKGVSSGKIICLEIEAESTDAAHKKANTISSDLLSNPLIENFMITEWKDGNKI